MVPITFSEAIQGPVGRHLVAESKLCMVTHTHTLVFVKGRSPVSEDDPAPGTLRVTLDLHPHPAATAGSPTSQTSKASLKQYL